MGSQNRWGRMPLPPQNIPPHVVPMWDTRAKMLALDYRESRALFRKITGSQLIEALNAFRLQVDILRKSPAARYRSLVLYRSALNEAVISRHWTVTWSALTNQHEIR
jgi:hypothetical protein